MTGHWVYFPEVLLVLVSDSEGTSSLLCIMPYMTSLKRKGRGNGAGWGIEQTKAFSSYLFGCWSRKNFHFSEIFYPSLYFPYILLAGSVSHYLPFSRQWQKEKTNKQDCHNWLMIQPPRKDSHLGSLGENKQVSKWLFGRQVTVPWQLCSHHF